MSTADKVSTQTKEIRMTVIDKQQEVQSIAQALYARNPDWVTFYREILGLRGAVRQHYPSPDSLSEFEQTEAYQKIQQMLAKLREQKAPANNPEEPTRVITVRLPKSLHEALRTEAHEHRTSMNKLCISKLLLFIDAQMVPAEA
jgi:predicted HicB family RNase H-like nuclease